jgi:hypothetical protein
MTLRAAAGFLTILASMAFADPRPAPFAVGALRRDGVIVPFAVFDGKRWSARWPGPARELDVPITIRSIPSSWWGPTAPLEQWQAWAGGAPQTVAVRQPDWVDAHCVRQIGLKTSYQSQRPVPPAKEQPFPKDGLAVSPPHDVAAIESLSPSAAEVQAFATELRDAFNKAERLVESQYSHPIKQRAREGVDPLIEAVYAYGQEPRVYYFEATRTYRRLGSSKSCEAIGFGSGWFRRDKGTVRPLTVAVDLLGCNRYGATYMFPFGIMTLDGKIFWLAQFSGWDHERFVVVEIQKKNVEAVVNTWGGSC